MSNPKPEVKSTPSSVYLIWNGPATERHILCATTTEEEAWKEIGRRVATGEGAPMMNPRPEEVVVIGEPHADSIQAVGDRVAKTVTDIGNRIMAQWEK